MLSASTDSALGAYNKNASTLSSKFNSILTRIQEHKNAIANDELLLHSYREEHAQLCVKLEIAEQQARQEDRRALKEAQVDRTARRALLDSFVETCNVQPDWQVADDAEMGYPAVRFGVPDNHFHAWFVGMRKAMEMMVTGDSLSGKECVRLGWANDSVPADELEAKVLEVAKRITQVPADLVQLNKRVVHRQMEIMGLHTGIRAGSELCALGTHQKSLHDFLAQTAKHGLKGALQQRDQPFGDYRTREGE